MMNLDFDKIVVIRVSSSREFVSQCGGSLENAEDKLILTKLIGRE